MKGAMDQASWAERGSDPTAAKQAAGSPWRFRLRESWAGFSRL